jgi:hypothetical protein
VSPGTRFRFTGHPGKKTTIAKIASGPIHCFLIIRLFSIFRYLPSLVTTTITLIKTEMMQKSKRIKVAIFQVDDALFE